MGVTLGDAIVYIRGDRTPYDRTQRGVEKDTRAWTSRVGGMIRSGIAVAATGAATAIAGIGAAGIKAALDAMPLQGVREAFQGITENADVTMRKLRQGSLGMVTDASLMRTYNEAFQLVGRSFADQLPEAMTYLRKVAAATNQDMGYMLDSLTKGVGRLSPMILDNLGIQASLAEATERASQKFGLEADQLSKAQIQAGMMDVVLQKLAENTARMPDVTENAATRWQQLKTTLQNLKDMAGEALIPILLALIEPVSDLAEKHGPKLIEWAQQASLWLAEKIPEGIALARRGLRLLARRGLRGIALDVLDSARTRLQEVDWRELGLSILQRIVDAALTGYEIVRGWVLGLRDQIKQRLEETDWSAIGQTILGKLTGAFESIKGAASEKLREILGGIFGGGGEGGGEGEAGKAGGVVGILDAISGFVSGPGGTALSIMGAIIGLLTGIGAPIGIAIGAIKLLSAAWESNFGGIRDIAADVLGNVNVLLAHLRAGFRRTVVRIKGLVRQFQASVEEGIGPFIDKAKEAWQWITQVALPVLRRWGRAFARGLQPHIKRIWEMLEHFITDIQPDLKALWDELRIAWEEISTLVKEELWPAIKDLLDELGINIDSVEGFAGALGDVVGTIMENDMKALLLGIRLAVRSVTGAVRLAKEQVSGWVEGLSQLVRIVTSAIKGIRRFARTASDLTGIELPEWLQSHSPPPLAAAIREITAAIGDMPSDIGARLGSIAAGAVQSYQDQRRYQTMYGSRIYVSGSGGSFMDELMEATVVP